MAPSFEKCAALAIFLLSVSTAQACETSYNVQAGDTLAEISQSQLGTVAFHEALHDANRDIIGSNPNSLTIGMTLRIPCQAADGSFISWDVLTNPQTLVQLIFETDTQILDIRPTEEIANGVIPGSVWVPFEDWSGPTDNPGKPHSPARLATLIGNAGLHLDRPIVVVNQGEALAEMGAAALVYWQLKSAGAANLAILEGGFEGWTASGLPTASTPSQPQSYAALVRNLRDWRADDVDVYGIATGQTEGILLDARMVGLTGANENSAVSGMTIPTAWPLPVAQVDTDAAGSFGELVAALAAMETEGQIIPVVSFSDVGLLGALNWFYASEVAGLANFKLYPESIEGWTLGGGQLAPVSLPDS